jgi:hypothetical protein
VLHGDTTRIIAAQRLAVLGGRGLQLPLAARSASTINSIN